MSVRTPQDFALEHEQIMSLADHYADCCFEQGLNQRTLDEAPENAREVLRKALTETQPPAGYALVPMVPTDAMLAAAQRAWFADPLRRTSTMYSAMVGVATERKS